MSDGPPDTSSAPELRLVSDEGETVAEPPPVQRETVQTEAPRPPAHPSIPSSNGPDVEPSDPTAEHHSVVSRRTVDDPGLYTAVEAILLVAVEPVPVDVLAAVIAAPRGQIRAVCEDLAREYIADERGFMLARVGGGYQMQTSAAVSEYVERFVGSRRASRLSAAAMETLAVVAYKQPISRAQISAVRGVNADGVVRTLIDQGYVEEVARDPGPTNAALLGTTARFLERLGLDTLVDLPSLADLGVDLETAARLDRLAASRPLPANMSASMSAQSTAS